WDAATGAELRCLDGHSGLVDSLAFSPDGSLLATGSTREFMVWDTATWARKHTLQTEGVGHRVCFTRNGARIASATSSGCRAVALWDAVKGVKAQMLPISGTVCALSFSPDGQFIAAADYGGHRSVTVCELARGRVVRKLPNYGLAWWGVNWKPADPRSLLAWTHFAVLWDVEPGSPLKQLPLNVGDGHPQAAFVQNGQQIVAFQALADGVQWRDISADAPTRTFPKGDISPACAAVSRDGKRLAYPHTANTIRICDVATGKSDASRAEPGLTLSGTPESLRALAFSPSGKLLAAGAANATAAVWDASSGRAVRTVRSSDSKATLRSIAFSPDETLLAAGGDDWTVHIWNLSAQDERRTLKGHTGQVASVAFSPGGELLASASYDGTVRLWDARTGAGTQVLTEHRSYVHEVSFSSDGRLLAAGAQDGALGLWRRTSDVKEGVQRAALPPKTERPTSKAKAPSEAVLPATAMVGEADVLALKPAYPGFFVLGTWGVGVRRDAFQRDKQAELDRVKQDLQRMKDLGINTAVANALYAPDEQPHTARLAHELGLKVIAINEGLAGIYKAKKPFTQNAATALVAQDAQRLKDSPNVLEHVVHLDPPEGHFKPQDWREMCTGSMEAD
ncbi:MAG: hypothetical protein FJ279_34740, partial [Planctomycetes bacterium]|nr:hypothetical protein [Planctomycetota bacterium]